MIQAAVFGYGTVGSGVVEVIETNQDIITKRVGDGIHVKYVLDLRDFPGTPIQERIVHDVNTIIEDDSIAIICETMGGVEPAYTFTKNALLKGKSVCTSNKELVAAHGPELIKIAEEHNCNYLFEASVGGGIPIIRTINSALTAEKIECIQGILNGTTNYILTKMEREGADFDKVLKEAQEKGYAERNPEADVEGYDAGRKIAILSSLMYGKNVKFENVFCEGITKITQADFAYAKKLGMTIKLVAMGKHTAEGKFAMVTPRLIGQENPLVCANDVFNAVFVQSNMLGDSMYYGRGAGMLPTASAVVGDVIEAARMLGKHAFVIWSEDDEKMSDSKMLVQKYLVRVKGSVTDKASMVEAAFDKVEYVECVDGEFAFITEEMSEKAYDDAAKGVNDILGMIRM